MLLTKVIPFVFMILFIEDYIKHISGSSILEYYTKQARFFLAEPLINKFFNLYKHNTKVNLLSAILSVYDLRKHTALFPGMPSVAAGGPTWAYTVRKVLADIAVYVTDDALLQALCDVKFRQIGGNTEIVENLVCKHVSSSVIG